MRGVDVVDGLQYSSTIHHYNRKWIDESSEFQWNQYKINARKKIINPEQILPSYEEELVDPLEIGYSQIQIRDDFKGGKEKTVKDTVGVW